MPKISGRQSTALFALIILFLIILCVGLLVIILKGQLDHESLNSSAYSSSIQRIGETIVRKLDVQTRRDVDGSDQLNATEPSSPDENTTVAIVFQNVWEHFRLPNYVIPIHYKLLLHPNLSNDNFTGHVEIDVNVSMAVNHLVLHAYKLNVLDSQVKSISDQKDVRIKKGFFYDPNEFYVLELESDIPPDVYQISITFSGTLVGSIVGFYKSRYTDRETGKTRFLASSKFQPTYARRAFPCFDEPTFKATFTVSLVHDANYIALSNMPAKETQKYENGELFVTNFEKSVPMVTYLTCFIVCDFQYKGTKTSGNKEFRVYATKTGVNHTNHALQFGSKVLQYFEDYFGLEYSLPKQDMVAIPDFVSGAMEHWGVITFREANLLYNPMKSSSLTKQRISSVISHEMAHMWFGNLVTMEWWDDLWLNEGFASYIEYKGVNEQYPHWDMLDQFVVEDLQPVLSLDSTMSSHPLVQPVSHPDEITEIFDGISYNKGASVLRMLEFFLGEENFRKGISKFLAKYQFKNAKTEDLWTELSSVSSDDECINISRIMRSWTEQMGFPYITIIRDKDNSTIFRAKQQRFVKNANESIDSDPSKDYVWHVPLSYITSTGLSGIVWLNDKSEKTFEIPISHNQWVKFNVNQTGYYIVNYEEKEWGKFIEVLNTNHKALSPTDRSGLLFDAFLLSEAGHLKYDILLSLMMYMKNETHLIPWETAYASLVYLSQVLELTDVHTLIRRYISELSEPLYNAYGWNISSGHLDNRLQNTIIGLSCHSGNQNCLSVASSLLQSWIQGQELSSTLKRLVYHYGMAEIGREEHWNFTWNTYLNEESSQERKMLLYGLAHIRVPALIHRFLEYSMDESKIRRQDFFTVLLYLSGNPTARGFVWNFIRDKWKELVERFTLNDRYLGLLVKRICSYFTTKNELLEMQRFFDKYPDAGAGKFKRMQALENVQNNIKWLEDFKNQVKSWLLVESISPWLHHRLPLHVIPRHYDLTIQPFTEEEYFIGSVSIIVEMKKKSRSIILHTSNLNITKTVVLNNENSSTISAHHQFYHKENDYWVIHFSEKLPVGVYNIYFEFYGEIRRVFKGLFKVPYVDPASNTERYILATQLQTTFARSVFPCFDEPFFKSTFSITILHNSHDQVLSNAIETVSIQMSQEIMKTSFETTVPMSTYLVCFAVGNFKYREMHTENKIRLRIYSTPHNVEKTSYALELSNAVIHYFEVYFNYSYPLKKLDMIAIPEFFGAMENWGLITFGESRLLIDQNSSENDKAQIASIVSHEIAHMWFGNLVTMNWWSDLWLNEGFATYMSFKCVEAIEPSWNYKNEFIPRSLYYALKKDATLSSHPVVKTIGNSNEISEIFDSIAYSKGAAILRMLETIMGKDFQKGISLYLKKFAYKTVNTEDLWLELTQASMQNLDIALLMNTWTMQTNYPCILVREVTNGFNVVGIQQHHFMENMENKHLLPSQFGYEWVIPVTYITSADSKMQSLILNSTNEVVLDNPGVTWIKFNRNFTGYYLVNYETNMWKFFTHQLLSNNFSIFTEADRANFLHDAFALANAGYLEYEIALNLSSYLRYEEKIVPWKIAYKVFDELILKLDNDTLKEILRHYVKDLSSNLYTNLAWKDSGNYIERNLRHLIINVACGNRNHECLTHALQLLRQWITGTKINSDLRHLAYKYGMQLVRDEKTWTHMWNSYLNENSLREKIKLLQGLANTRNRTLLKKLISLAENEEYVSRSHYFNLLEYINVNPTGHSLVCDFIYRNWTDLVQRFTLNSHSLGSFVYDVYKSFNTEDQLKEVMNLFRKYPKASIGKTLKYQALNTIRSNIKWLEINGEGIQNWLNKYVFMPWKQVRLPRHVIPSSYNIYMHPNVSNYDFKGNVNITVNVSKPSDHIIVHSDQLFITDAEIWDTKTQKALNIIEAFPFELNHFWVLRLDKNINEGMFYLLFNFSGLITSYAEGLTWTSYTNNATQEKRILLYTQFEPHYARKMFPCFDEPSMKAKFRMTVVHDPDYSAVSNMPEESITSRDDGLIEVKFEESFPMSTYLVCIVVSDYGFTETNISYNKKLRYFAPPDRLNNTLHTLNITPTMLKIFEEFYDIPYALPKLDFVAIPNFPMGGMENWGLVVLGEVLLIDEFTSLSRITHSDKVVAHELAHQWFGNLVTMRWWDDIWLNEGFSTFAMYTSLRHFHSDSDEIEAGRKVSVMMKDASQYSRPIVKQVSGRVDIVNMFDSISYEKGASIISMLQNVMKSDFKKGLSNYLKKYAYDNAETKDLWNEFSNATQMDIDIAEVMDTWTLQMGFPYVEVELKGNTFTARQKRFFEDYGDVFDSSYHQSPYGYIWKIPLTYMDIDTGVQYSYWLNEPEGTFPLIASVDACLKFNVNFSGYYIVKYDDSGWNKLSQKLLSNPYLFSGTDRYNLLFDVAMLVQEDLLLYDVALDVTKYMRKEKLKHAWQLMIKEFFTVISDNLRPGSDTYSLWKKYIMYLTEELYEDLRNNITTFDSEFNTVIVYVACTSQNQQCLEDQHEKLEKWMIGEISSDDLSTFSFIISVYGNETVWEKLWNQVQDENTTASEQSALGFGLSQFQDEHLIKKTLYYTLNHDGLSSYTIFGILYQLRKNPIGLPLLWDTIKSHWSLLSKKMNNRERSAFNNLVGSVCKEFSTDSELEEVKNTLKMHPETFSIDEEHLCISIIEKNIEWANTHGETIGDWLRWNVPN